MGQALDKDEMVLSEGRVSRQYRCFLIRVGLMDTPEGWIYSSEQFFSQGKLEGIPIKLPR